MARYRSYLVRWWALQDGDQRIEIEEIQSGERAVVATIAAAIRWVDGRGASADAVAPGQPPGKGGDGDTTTI